MPQGALKQQAKSGGGGSSKKTAHSVKQKQRQTGGHRVVKAKNHSAARAREMARRGAAGLTANLERQLAQRAGHTELVAAREAKANRAAPDGKAGGKKASGGGGAKSKGKKS